jgi:uncharacterized protein (UPF0264 family)
MTMMLASVRSLDEAVVALDGGADLIDLKEPARGALGALDHAAVRICVRAIDGRRPVSATIGDIPSMDATVMTAAVERMAATGVDFIKIGFFAHPLAAECARALSAMTGCARLIAVLFPVRDLPARCWIRRARPARRCANGAGKMNWASSSRLAAPKAC